MLPRYVSGKIIGVLISEENEVFFFGGNIKMYVHVLYNYSLLFLDYHSSACHPRDEPYRYAGRPGSCISEDHVWCTWHYHSSNHLQPFVSLCCLQQWQECTGLHLETHGNSALYFIHEFVKQRPRLFIRRLKQKPTPKFKCTPYQFICTSPSSLLKWLLTWFKEMWQSLGIVIEENDFLNQTFIT